MTSVEQSSGFGIVADDGPVDNDAYLQDEVGTLDDLIRSVQAQKMRDAPPQVRAELQRLPEVVDDYVRNYLVAKGLSKTLGAFEEEWYLMAGTAGDKTSAAVPDVYVELAQLQETVHLQQSEVDRLSAENRKLAALLDGARRERDFHRANHGRVVQEKDKLSKDVKGLQDHAAGIDPTLAELRAKLDAVQKDKMLLKLERDKLATRTTTLEDRVRELEQLGSGADTARKSTAKGAAAEKNASGVAPFVWPTAAPVAPAQRTPANASGWQCRSSFKAHALAVTHVALHPRKPVVASASDDGTWRLMSLPQGELVMSGEGHKDWVAGIAMHPKGTMVATASGDKTVKLWDFGTNACKNTLRAHTEGVWCVEFHSSGDILASGSLDHTVRVWDAEYGRCRQTLRGHVDAVNAISWLPGTNSICTASGDKTVSLWDARAGHCTSTFYGHHSAVTGVAATPAGNSLLSCDTSGIVTVWDVRMVTELQTFNCGPHPANCVSVDGSGQLAAVASDDALIHILTLADGKQSTLRGHDDAVQHAAFDPQTNGFLVSCGSDATVRYWS